MHQIKAVSRISIYTVDVTLYPSYLRLINLKKSKIDFYTLSCLIVLRSHVLHHKAFVFHFAAISYGLGCSIWQSTPCTGEYDPSSSSMEKTTNQVHTTEQSSSKWRKMTVLDRTRGFLTGLFRCVNLICRFFHRWTWRVVFPCTWWSRKRMVTKQSNFKKHQKKTTSIWESVGVFHRKRYLFTALKD